MSWLLCGCCNGYKAPPHLLDEAEGPSIGLGHRERNPLTAELRLFAAMWCRSHRRFQLEKLLPQVGPREQKASAWVADVSSAPTYAITSLLNWLLFTARRAVLSVTACPRAVACLSRPNKFRTLRLRRTSVEFVRCCRPLRSLLSRW